MVDKLFDVGKQFPPTEDIERLAKYKRGKMIFSGKHWDIYDRTRSVIQAADKENADILSRLRVSFNILDVIVSKPADMLVGEKPLFELPNVTDTSIQQARLNSIVEENNLVQQMHEMAIGAGYRGDSFIKVYHSYRQDYSALADYGLEPPTDIKPEPILEAVNPEYVFVERSEGAVKKVKAVNIARVVWIQERTNKKFFVKPKDEYIEVPYLMVERHIPNYIIYEKYRLTGHRIDNTYNVPIDVFDIVEQLPTGRDFDYVETGVNDILIRHIPYKSTDDELYGIGTVEKVEEALRAIEEKLILLEYVLYKHAQPTFYGPPINSDDPTVKLGGVYIDVEKDQVTPGAVTWDSQMSSVFKSLDILINFIFQMSETPQWVFGTSVTSDGNSSGGGTSHTDSQGIRLRFMPLLSKVNRIRTHFDVAIRDALYLAMKLENYANDGVEDFESYEPEYPLIMWKDGLPRDEEQEAKIMAIRTGNKATLDVASAVKRLDEVDDEKAQLIIDKIRADEDALHGTIDASIFNEPMDSFDEQDDQLTDE